MGRAVWVFFFLTVAVGSASAQIISPIVDISLIEDQRFRENRPPAKLTLGVEMREAAYFKLLREGDVIEAGRLNRGLNFIGIPASDYFLRSGVFEIVLDMRVGGRNLRRQIELDVQMDADSEPPPETVEFEDLHYDLSLYVGDKQLASSSLRHYGKFPLAFDIPPLPLDHRPYDPEWKESPMANSFSILSAVALALEGYKAIRKKTAHKPYLYEYETKKVIAFQFTRRTDRGRERPVGCVLRLSTR